MFIKWILFSGQPRDKQLNKKNKCQSHKIILFSNDNDLLSFAGFGFVTFQSEDVVDKVCEIHFHEINNKMVST